MCFSAQVPSSKLLSLVYFCSKLRTAETPLSENQGKHSKLKFGLWDDWPSGLYSLRQVTEVKLGRVRSDFGWVTSED